MPDDPQKPSGGMVEQAVSWLRGQEFNNVLLFAILTAMAYGTYWAVNYAVPAHLLQIQHGYERQAETFDRANERDHELIRGLLKRDGIEIPTSTTNMARRPEQQ